MGMMAPDYSNKGSGMKGARVNRGSNTGKKNGMTPDYSTKPGGMKGARVNRGK